MGAAGASFGFGAISSIGSAIASGILSNGMLDAQATINDANTYAQNTVNQANAEAANLVRGANNQFIAAQASLSNVMRSLGNKAKMDAGGAQVEAINTNIDRLQDQAVRGTLTARIQASEQMGAVRAAAAAQGVGGTSAQMLQKTMELTSARINAARNQNTGYQTYDLLMQKAGLTGNMVRSLDEGQTFAAIDYSTNVAPLVQSPISAGQFAPSPIMSGLASALSYTAKSPGLMKALADTTASTQSPAVLSDPGSDSTRARNAMSTQGSSFDWSNIGTAIKNFFLT